MKIRGKLTIIRAPNKTVFFCFLMFYLPLVSRLVLIGALTHKNNMGVNILVYEYKSKNDMGATAKRYGYKKENSVQRMYRVFYLI